MADEKSHWIRDLTCEGCGIRSVGRLLNIGKSSVQRIIERIADAISIAVSIEEGQRYEMDELKTYKGNKKNESWVMYAINKKGGKVIDFCIGRRTKENIGKVVKSVLKLNPKRVYTDKLDIYPGLIANSIHRTFEYCTSKIERFNLTLRTHLKRLSGKSICYSKSEEMVENSVKMYCYGRREHEEA
jgi:IS1 family transposase